MLMVMRHHSVQIFILNEQLISGVLPVCYVYLLSCRGGRIYTGYTTDFSRRLRAHQLGKGSKFTRAFAPVTPLVCWKIEGNVTLARQLEYRIKQLDRRDKLMLAQCQGEFEKVIKDIIGDNDIVKVDLVNVN